ncbi:glycerol-3-phosphate 1-O-acyltransferase PlsY [Paenibacillus sp. GSMTC-2017]|uniref:glycerol-3-phosphate 1-O-acyltransferase PlsY n=1 Tax=Paenibacillus sp. GSMTC-2017 TaxID=2794350 RepID=UPI0018D98F0E|nr:glycerol-3-phosphate 1-O-acyltransferase PlsY [Paenibacillus sp. GSMTC-2017]MBH5317974.1 glycerol-3-phosphate 1-O-acyltransferase PlsY [Paenibacillus sp. GSMTC-2017]
MVLDIIAVVLCYLIGSISFSIAIAKWVKGIDIRQHGSGNAGATNTLRVLGKGPGIVVFFLDIAKGVAAIFLGNALSDNEWIPVLCGLAVIIGHNWPIWFRFKGGKGIATTVGVIATLALVPALCAGVVAVVCIVLTRYVSLGSLLFAAFTPIFIILFDYSLPLLSVALVICAFAFIRHRTNIVKLMQGTENKLGAKKGA